ncbi:flagellin [Sphingomonas morindae]|uniref:Flagellin n=1 Tax=Sphingomonas morindae TaxID=1541170 RepID=A0ABY4X554_9SPHN|nr:flagellin [Sphingomonas morindae]USI72018.1 flagellin [Sphingomonas morindae]
MGMTINTNVGAMAALQTLNATSKQLQTTQARINTGLNVASTKDDSSTYVIAQKLRGDVSDMKAVTNSLNNGKSVLDVAVSGAEQINEILSTMATKAKEAADPSKSKDDRDILDKDFQKYKETIKTIIDSAEFNGTNLLKKAGGDVSALTSIRSSDATAFVPQTIKVTNQGLEVAATTATATGAIKFSDETKLVDSSTVGATNSNATEAVKLVADTQQAFKAVLGDLGAAARQIETQLTFVSKLSDTVTSGIGNLVDADMAKESANIQALQVKQQLGVQALGIANQTPQTILSLFK